MKKIKTLPVFAIIAIMIFPLKVYSFKEEWKMDESRFDDYYCYMTNSTAFHTKILEPEVKSIKFRQDDDYYYFDYDINYISDDIKRESYINSTPGSDNIFVTQFKDTWPSFIHNWHASYEGNYSCTNVQAVNGEITYGTYKFTYIIQKQQRYNSSYDEVSNTYTTHNVSSKILIPISGLKTDHYFNTPDCLHGYYYGETVKKENGLLVGSANVTSNATSLSDDYWQYNYTGTIKINKSEFLKYRYLTLLATDSLQEMRYDENKNEVYNGHWNKYDIRGYSIDLNEYRVCDHEWELVNMGDKVNHEIVCTKCGWAKKENHELVFEYDGILNNECACGYHNMLNLTVNTNNTNENIVKRIPSFEKIATISFPEKIGNNFQYYNVYEKYKIGISTYSEIYVGTKSEIDKYSNNFSIRFNAVYKPITYTFHYSNENMFGLDLKEYVEDQVFIYDSGQVIKNAEYVKGKSFIGWSLDKNKGTADFNVGCIIKNFSDIDKSEFTLYPIYDDMYYYVRYITNEGTFKNGSNTLLVKYFYDENKTFEIPRSDDNTFDFLYYTYNGIKVSDLADIRDYPIFRDTIINLRANITHTYRSSSSGSSGGESDTSSSYGPSGNPSSQNTSNNANGLGPGENFLTGEFGPGDIINQSNGIMQNNDTNLAINNNLLYKKSIIDDTVNTNTEDKAAYENSNIPENKIEIKTSENYENLMDYLREKYEKNKINDENADKDLDNDKYAESIKKQNFIGKVVEKYGGVFLSVFAVIISAIWTFIPGKI